MAISSNTLFHFTRSDRALIGILRDEFKPHYCLEDYSLLPGASPDSSNLAMPMVSFCDIPLSQTAHHMKYYGEYAIGLTKEWGRKKGVSPVLYAYPESSTAVAIEALGSRIRQLGGSAGAAEEREKLSVELYALLAHLKQYEGRIFRDGAWRRTVRFYDEREWRYVPDFTWVGAGRGYLLEEDFVQEDQRSRAQDLIDDVRLGFDPDDIRYLIVPDDDDILGLQDLLFEIKEKYDTDAVRLLGTRIITARQVREDF